MSAVRDSPGPEARKPPGSRPRIPTRVGNGPVAGVLGDALRFGLAFALRTAPSRTAALEAAAAAVEHGLIGRDTASDRMTVPELLDSDA